jgi:hypothetical protein
MVKPHHRQPPARRFTTHNEYTHFPKCPKCPICQETMMRHVSCRKDDGTREPDAMPDPVKFADEITADYKVLNEDNKSRSEDKLALVMQDGFTYC